MSLNSHRGSNGGRRNARVKRARESRVTHGGLRRGSAWEPLRMVSSQVKSLCLSDFNHILVYTLGGRRFGECLFVNISLAITS